MIETVMLVALGFSAATVLALIIMPFVSRRAARLARLRLHETAPLSMDEIAAERDGLRALSAVEQRRLEQRLERAVAERAAGQAELGRRTAELVGIEQIREAERAEKAVIAEQLERSQGSLATALAERDTFEREAKVVTEKLEDAERKHRLLIQSRDDLDALAEERRGTIAGLETRCAGLDMRLGDRDDEIARIRGEQGRLNAALDDLARERDLTRKELALATTQRSMLQDDIASLTRRLDDQRLKLQVKTEALGNAERRLMSETAERKAVMGAFADLKRRFDLLEARLIEAGGLAAETMVDADLDSLRASVMSVADHALDVVAERHGSRPVMTDEDAALGPAKETRVGSNVTSS